MKRSSRKLVVGQLIGQLSLLLAVPALTRLLSIEEMGIYQTAFSVALVLQPLATLRRELVIPFGSFDEARKHRRRGLLFASGCCATLALGAALALAFLNWQTAELLICTAFLLMSFALMYIENAFLIRFDAHGKLALRNLFGGIVSAVLQVVSAMIFPNAVSIALALLLGRALVTALTIVKIPTGEPDLNVQERRPQRAFSAILSAMVATASNQAIVIVSFGTLGPGASAQVGLGQRIAGAPASLVGQALTQIALGAAAPLIREHRAGLTARLRLQTLATGAAAALTTVALVVGAPILAVPILGQGWELAGVLTAVFAVPMSLTLVALPATSLLIPLGRERLLLTLQICRLTAILLTLITVSASTGDVITTSIATAAVWTLAYVPLLMAAFIATAAHDRNCATGVSD